MTNPHPKRKGVGKAMIRRVHAVPFEVDIPHVLQERGLPTPKQEDVIARLVAEAPGVLDDLVQASAEWYSLDNRLVPSQQVLQATDEYLLEQDPLRQWVEACRDTTRLDVRELRPFEDWYNLFIRWSRLDSRYYSTRWLGDQLKNHHKAQFKRIKTTQVLYEGPTWKPEALVTLSSSEIRKDGSVDIVVIRHGEKRCHHHPEQGASQIAHRKIIA